MANKDYSTMSWDDLYAMRLANKDPQFQAEIAPYEHRAFAREQVAQNPMLAPVYAVAVPGYQAFKSMVGTSRTKPSMKQIGQGLLGASEGYDQGVAQLQERAAKGLLNLFQ